MPDASISNILRTNIIPNPSRAQRVVTMRSHERNAAPLPHLVDSKRCMWNGDEHSLESRSRFVYAGFRSREFGLLRLVLGSLWSIQVPSFGVHRPSGMSDVWAFGSNQRFTMRIPDAGGGERTPICPSPRVESRSRAPSGPRQPAGVPCLPCEVRSVRVRNVGKGLWIQSRSGGFDDFLGIRCGGSVLEGLGGVWVLKGSRKTCRVFSLSSFCLKKESSHIGCQGGSEAAWLGPET